MKIRLSDQRTEFIEGWVACRNWGIAEPYPDCPYEWGWELDGVNQYQVWHSGLSARLGPDWVTSYIDDIPEPKVFQPQLDLFD